MPVIRSKRLAAAATAAIAAVSLTTAARAQMLPTQQVEAPSRWEVDIGGGAAYGFAVTSSNKNTINGLPWGSFDYKERVYGNPLDGLGYNIVKADRLHIGVQIRPHYGGPATSSTIKAPGTGADAAVYVYGRTWQDFIVGGRVTHDITNVSDGTEFFGSVTHQDVTPVGLLESVAYVRAADHKSMQAYYGVTPAESAAANLPVYNPGGGFTDAGIAALLIIPIGKHYGAGGFVNYERTIGVAANSPLSQREENAFRGGVIVVRRFRGF